MTVSIKTYFLTYRSENVFIVQKAAPIYGHLFLQQNKKIKMVITTF